MTVRGSPELAAIARRWIEAYVGARGETIRHLLSAKDPLLVCGTGPEEFWQGDIVRRTLATHVAEIPPGEMAGTDYFAFESGDSGWVLINGFARFGRLTAPVPVRVTLIFVLEDDIWKVQHVHNSLPSSHVDVLGFEHSAFDALMAAAEVSAAQFGRSGSATVMFTDIVGSSALAEALGDHRWSAIVRDHVALVGEAIREENGRLVKSLGDGTMSSFDSAGAAMRAALAVQRRLAQTAEEPKLQLRIGIHTGDVVQADNDFFGTVVNKAARIAALARAGEIRVSDATRIMVGGSAGFSFADPSRVMLKGMAGDHLVYRLEPPL